MQHNNVFERPGPALTVLVYASTLAAVMLLGGVLAYWTWAWFAPRPEPRARSVVETAGRMGSTQNLFGNLERDRNAASMAGGAVKLLGVVAATGGRPGYAVMQLDARRSVTVREGQDAAPGIHLSEVHADHVVLTREGVRETLAWSRKTQKQ